MLMVVMNGSQLIRMSLSKMGLAHFDAKPRPDLSTAMPIQPFPQLPHPVRPHSAWQQNQNDLLYLFAIVHRLLAANSLLYCYQTADGSEWRYKIFIIIVSAAVCCCLLQIDR